MLGSYKNIIAAAGAFALLSSQAAYAAPARIDPLVALSALGTAQSRTAVCAAGATAAAAGAATAAAQGAAPGCVLPVQAAPPVAQTPPPPYVETAAAPKAMGMWPALLGLVALAAVAALLLSGDNDDEGDLTPISPA